MVYTRIRRNNYSNDKINGGAYSEIKKNEIEQKKNQTIIDIPETKNNYNETEEKLKKFINFKFK